ncbi:hypothetical protein [Risungbinella massiliensis]|nr:hypothetical protein [Risungbinella massiliensis]
MKSQVTESTTEHPAEDLMTTGMGAVVFGGLLFGVFIVAQVVQVLFF